MEAINFAYWLQGFAELNGKPPTKEQWEMIKEHLNLVFKKETKLSLDSPQFCCNTAQPTEIKFPTLSVQNITC